MLILPKPPNMEHSEWDEQETEGMRDIMGLYGKTWHFWQVDRGDELPLGKPVLMGSLTEESQMDLKGGLKERDEEHDVKFHEKASMRMSASVHEEGGKVAENADWWWKEAKKNGKA